MRIFAGKASEPSLQSRPLCALIRPAAFPSPRVLKIAEVAQADGFTTLFIGALRDPSLSRIDNWHGIKICRLGIPYPQSSLWYLIGSPLFALSVCAWLTKHRPEVVHASDVEGMFGVALYKMLFGKSRVLFNIHDNFALRYKVPKWLKKTLARVESTLGSCADVVLVPDETRLALLAPWVPKQSAIIPNSPPDPGYEPKELDTKLRIFASGWLSWQRGFRMLGGLARSRTDVQLVVCGSGPKDVMNYIRSLPRTEYYGYVPQTRALEIGRTCDVVFAYYDPTFEINKYASSNKLFDALALGRPILMNTGLRVSDWVLDKRVGFCLPYRDVTALSLLVDRILANPALLMSLGQRARSIYDAEYAWDQLKHRVHLALSGTS